MWWLIGSSVVSGVLGNLLCRILYNAGGHNKTELFFIQLILLTPVIGLVILTLLFFAYLIAFLCITVFDKFISWLFGIKK